MDSNLHHQTWNPLGHCSSHKEATDLVTTCGKHGFQLASPRHIPTFYLAKGRGLTIDLIWSNFKASSMITSVRVSDENFGSDHQLLTGNLSLKGGKYVYQWVRPKWNTLQKSTVCEAFERQARLIAPAHDLNEEAVSLTGALQIAQTRLGWYVRHRDSRSKAWWNKEVLDPIMQVQSPARQWMIRLNTPEAPSMHYIV